MTAKNDVSKALGFLANSKLNINEEAILALTSGKNTIPKNRNKINENHPDCIFVWGDETVEEIVENIRKNENEAVSIFLLYFSCLNVLFPGKLKEVLLSLKKYPVIFNKIPSEMKKELGVKTGGCFIATATMGSYNHPLVLDLREFRDTRLNKFKFGRYFIKIYYKLSPPISYLISKSILLRKVFYYILIKPVHLIIKKK